MNTMLERKLPPAPARPPTPATALWRRYRATLTPSDPVWRAAMLEAHAVEWHEHALWYERHDNPYSAATCHHACASLLATALTILAQVAS